MKTRSIKKRSKKRNTKKVNQTKGGYGYSDDMFGDRYSGYGRDKRGHDDDEYNDYVYKMQNSNNNRRSKNDSKIRVQFLNPITSPSPYSVISVIKGPTTGIFDYMWYNINNIEEMLATSMNGLKVEPPLPSEIVYNVKHNDKSDQLNKEDYRRKSSRSRSGRGEFDLSDYIGIH